MKFIDESENSDLEKEEIEAKYIADKIHDMINSGFKVKDGDIMREARLRRLCNNPSQSKRKGRNLCQHSEQQRYSCLQRE